MKNQTRFYLVQIWGSVEPQKVGKVHRTFESLVKAAKKLYNDPENHNKDEDGLFYLRVTNKELNLCSFTNEDLED